MSSANTFKNVKRVNEGFEIIKSEYYNERYEIVLGQLRAESGNIILYVTWECMNEQSYFWGHYFPTAGLNAREKALKDYHTRLAKNYDNMIW